MLSGSDGLRSAPPLDAHERRTNDRTAIQLRIRRPLRERDAASATIVALDPMICKGRHGGARLVEDAADGEREAAGARAEAVTDHAGAEQSLDDDAQTELLVETRAVERMKCGSA